MRFSSLLVLLLLVGAPGCGGDGGSNDASEPGSDEPRAMLPVSALLDGDTPVAGARVQVYAEAGGTLLHPLGPDVTLTSDTGIALLEFDSLPQTFVVQVTGGHAEGVALGGALSARVNEYSNGTVVSVSPVTSLVEQWERDDPSVDHTAAVYSALGIPEWADDLDLSATDRWFDGDTFLEHTGGDLAVALPQLLTAIEGGESVSFPGQDVDQPTDLAKWWEEVDVTELIAGGFADLGISLLFEGAQAGGRWLIGKLLDEWGLTDVRDFLLPKSDTELILEILTSLNKRVTDLQITVESIKNAVAESQYSQLVAQLNPQIAAIDAFTKELAFVAKMKPEDPTRVGYSKLVVQHIKENLADTPAAAQLHLALDNPAPAANDILKAASQVYGTQRWFTTKSSNSIRAVHEYFALYQFRLAVLLTNYKSTEPTIFSRDTIRESIGTIESNINAQKTDRLKPPVPDDKFIDTRTMTMWDRKPAWVSGEPYKPIEGTCHCSTEGHFCDLQDSTWPERAKGLATEEEFRALIDGWDLNRSCGASTCPQPLAWLIKEVGLVTIFPGSGFRDLGFVWLGPEPVSPVRFGFLGCGYNYLTRINLLASDHPGPHIFHDTLYDRDPNKYFAHAMNRQGVAPGTFWWPLGGR